MKSFNLLNILFFLIIIFCPDTSAGSSEKLIKLDNNDLNYMRAQFYKATENEDDAIELENFIHKKFSDNYERFTPTLLAYYGALEAVKAQFTYNPYSKFKYVINGLKKLDNAVKLAQDVLEIRFLRFAVLDNIPAVFGVGDDREADKEIIYKLLLRKDFSDVDYKLQKGIAEFLIKSERLSKDYIKNLLNIFSDISINE